MLCKLKWKINKTNDMKLKKTIHLFTCFLILIIVLGCQKDESSNEESVIIEQPIPTEEDSFEPVYFNGMAGRETENPDFPYMVQHENGEVMLLTAKNDEPTGIIYFVDENTTAQLTLYDEMLPSRVSYNNEQIVLFENYREGLVDIAVIVDDDFQIYRDIVFPTDLTSKNFTFNKQQPNWSGFFSALGTTINAGLCVIAVAATAVPSLGATVPAGVIVCGGALVGTVLLLRPSDSAALNATAQTAGMAGNTYGCVAGIASGNPLVAALNCVNSMIDAGGLLTGGYEELTQGLSELIALAEGGLQTGDGDVKFTLTWDNDTDLDLYVTEPSGDVIWYGNRLSSTGGQLDVDDTDGEGPENIFWPTDFARPGSYRVEVKMYSGNKETTFRLKPKVGDTFQNTVVFGISFDGEVVFVGNYILYAGEGGKLISEWQNKSEILSSIQNLTAMKEPKLE